jgi:hypothetical protein
MDSHWFLKADCNCIACQRQCNDYAVVNQIIDHPVVRPIPSGENGPVSQISENERKIARAALDRIGDAAARKNAPLFSGCIDYFPDALLAVAELSKIGNDQHNPGSPLHWDRSKSGDEKDALARHLVDAGTLDTDGVRHSAKVAWRALANLQKEIEAERG